MLGVAKRCPSIQMIPLKQSILNSLLKGCQRKYDKRLRYCWSVFTISITYIFLKLKKTDDTLFVCSWQMILLGPRLGSGRIWDYFSTSQQQFSCSLSLLHYKNTRVKSNFQASNSKNIPVIWDISYSLGWELFTFLDWTVDTHFLFLYSHWGLFFREALTRSCVASVEKRVTLWS